MSEPYRLYGNDSWTTWVSAGLKPRGCAFKCRKVVSINDAPISRMTEREICVSAITLRERSLPRAADALEVLERNA
jgi:hypothetical protein